MTDFGGFEAFASRSVVFHCAIEVTSTAIADNERLYKVGICFPPHSTSLWPSRVEYLAAAHALLLHQQPHASIHHLIMLPLAVTWLGKTGNIDKKARAPRLFGTHRTRTTLTMPTSKTMEAISLSQKNMMYTALTRRKSPTLARASRSEVLALRLTG